MQRKLARDITYQQLFENNRQWAAAMSVLAPPRRYRR